MVTHHDSISRCSSFLDYAWLRVIFLSLLLISNSVFAGPTGSGSENAVSLPAGCDVIGDYFGDGVEKCTADPATGAVKCFIAKVECCGNGRLDGEIRDASTGAVSAVAETCEVQTPGCRADCTMCGDNVINVDQGEVCDRGLQNGTAGSNCTQSCTVPVCGNGVWEDSNSNPVEECDGTSFKPQDQNKVGKVCGPSTDPATRCKLFYCGDGRIDNGETCDGDVFQTQHQGKPGLKCSNSCQVHFCGDGTKNNSPDCSTAGGASCSEQCDDSNSSNNDSCTNLCYTARCGDGFVQGDEECDGTEFSSQYSAKPGKSCDNQCQVHYCGDGTKDSSLGEECDDGNDSNYDSCTTACEPNVCGDGNPYTGVEQCDDGNTSNADLCTNACLPNVCGDGHLKTGVEQCDDKNLINNDGCSANCTPDCRPTDQPSVHIVPGAAHTVTIGTCPVYYQPIYVQGGANYPVNLSVSGYSGVSWAYISGNTLVYSKCIYPTTRWETYSHWVCTIWCCGGCHANYYYYDLHLQHSSAASIYVSGQNFCGSSSAHHYASFNGYGLKDNYRVAAAVSPVALILDPNIKSVEQLPVSLVDFKLSEDQGKNEKVAWLGSSLTGILVWEPKEQGQSIAEIDGRNLFGNWTFGKQWANGYDALASLDKDKDSWLRDAELEGIKLWVDENSDGNVDDFEIYELSAYDVKALSVAGKTSNKNHLYGIDFIINDQGFEKRSKDKSKSFGQSFDWFVPKKVSSDSFERNVDRLKADGYDLYQWRQVPLEYFDNKVNGYLAVKKSSAGYEGFAYAGVRSKGQNGESYYIVGQTAIKSAKAKNGEIKFSFSLTPGELITMTAKVDNKGTLKGKSVNFDKREFYKMLGGIEKMRLKDGSTDLPFGEEYSSELVIEPISIVPTFFDDITE